MFDVEIDAVVYMCCTESPCYKAAKVNTSQPPLGGLIIQITKKFANPLQNTQNCNFTTPHYWPSNLLKILFVNP